MRALRLLSLAALMIALPVSTTAAPELRVADDSETPYRLGPGDKLRVTVFTEARLNGEYIVATDGNISLPLVGEIPARGETIAGVREALRQRLANGILNDPKVAIEPVAYRPYYILGEVNKPGEYIYSAGIKLEQAVAAAGGFTYRANRGTVFLRRGDDAAERRIKLRKQQVRVMPGDTIRIGERYF